MLFIEIIPIAAFLLIILALYFWISQRNVANLSNNRSVTQQLAGAIGKTAGFLSQIERGQARPSLATLKDLGNVLGVPFSWFAPLESRGDQSGVAEMIVRADDGSAAWADLFARAKISPVQDVQV